MCFSDRLSNHGFFANFFRLFLSCLAYEMFLQLKNRIQKTKSEKAKRWQVSTIRTHLLKIGATIKLLKDEYTINYPNDLLIDENEEVAFWNISKREDINLISSKPINIGFAHGIPGIISLLLDCVQFDICKIEIQKILEKVFRFILKYRNISGLSQFPKYANIVNGNDNFSPLAWCYGDIGISISLLKYGAACAKDEFFEMGTNIGLQACNRRSVRESGVLDAGFCHGTSGLSCQYNILHKYTGHSDFLKSQEYWLKKTIEYSNFDKHSVAGFRMYIDDDLWQPSFGLLNGIAGIGLTFLNYIEPEIVDWRTFFNLPKL